MQASVANAAAVGSTLGAFYSQNDSISSDVGSVPDGLHVEISGLLSDMREDFGNARPEADELRERMIRFEILIEDKLPSSAP